jgi:3-methyladenine DNA glycosylase AlkD
MAMTAPEVLAWLERRGTKRNRDAMARYAIVAPRAYGVSVGDLRSLGRQLGTDHALAQALWKTGWYEARMLTAFVADPARVTPAQMDRWTRDFDNWAICDHLCFHLYDRTPHAWKKIDDWGGRKEEFVKRAAFALLASVALHDKSAPDAPFKNALKLIERAARDERNFVKKGVSWALRSVGERSEDLYDATLASARRLAESDDESARWIGRDAMRQMNTSAVKKRVAVRAARNMTN